VPWRRGRMLGFNRPQGAPVGKRSRGVRPGSRGMEPGPLGRAVGEMARSRSPPRWGVPNALPRPGVAPADLVEVPPLSIVARGPRLGPFAWRAVKPAHAPGKPRFRCGNKNDHRRVCPRTGFSATLWLGQVRKVVTVFSRARKIDDLDRPLFRLARSARSVFLNSAGLRGGV